MLGSLSQVPLDQIKIFNLTVWAVGFDNGAGLSVLGQGLQVYGCGLSMRGQDSGCRDMSTRGWRSQLCGFIALEVGFKCYTKCIQI